MSADEHSLENFEAADAAFFSLAGRNPESEGAPRARFPLRPLQARSLQPTVIKNMDLRKLKTLIDLVSESGVAELEITEGEDRVRIVNRTSAPAQPVQSTIAIAPQPQAAAPAAAQPAA